MKNIASISLLVLLLFGTSCKKTETVAAPVDLSGTTWKGLANVPGLGLSNKPFTLIYNADGTLAGSLENTTSFAIAGTWNLTPNSSTVRIFFELQSVGGKYVGQAYLDAAKTKMESGIATNATTPSANINFEVSKQ